MAAAEAFAAAAGVGNIRFLAADLAKLDPASLPSLDFVSLHGVWACVPPAVRQGMFALIRAQLSPRGLSYVSYNAMPGAASLAGLRSALRDQPGDDVEALPGALRVLRDLAEGGARFFAEHAIATRSLKGFEGTDLRYIAHEYLTRCSKPLSLRELALEMAGAGLEVARPARAASRRALAEHLVGSVLWATCAW